MRDFRKREVWQLAHAMTVNVCRQTTTFSSEEKDSLTDQMRRMAVSIEANLAEGCGRGGDVDCRRLNAPMIYTPVRNRPGIAGNRLLAVSGEWK
jgi:hypothetical protein